MSESSEIQVLPRKERFLRLETKIQESEQKLGINSEFDRLVEASLFIDRKFLNYAIITGVTQKPERIFGNKAWADYLDARIFARQYGNQDLSLNFIVELHKRLTNRSNSKISGKIRNMGVIGISDNEAKKPVKCSPEQVRAIETNPQLSFERVPPEDQNSTTGFIVYPHIQTGEQTQAAILKDLEELCKWFNNEKKQENYNPHKIAGLLQHRLISLHPFMDSNGRLTRLLMNWSLENDGEPPSIIANPGEDILTDEETWISKISDVPAPFPVSTTLEIE